jgi:hypothetical protein
MKFVVIPREGVETCVPGAAQHAAKRSDALQTRDRIKLRVWYDPVSAKQHFVLHCARDTVLTPMRLRGGDS